jgi:hypothetical protein
MPDYDAQAAAAADAARHSGADDESAPVGLAVFQAPDEPYAPPVRPADQCSCGGVRTADRRGVVDISVKLTTLARLDNDPALLAGFGPVIADIARQVALAEHHAPSWQYSVTDEDGLLLHHGHIQRRPSRAEAAFTRARDQLCATPGCTIPADRCELDHRREYDRGGPSHHGNLGPGCIGHHGLRTNHRDYKVAINARGEHTWTTPNGRQYIVGPADRLGLTADRDNPTGAAEATPPGPPTKGANEHITGYSEATTNAFKALIGKYLGPL